MRIFEEVILKSCEELEENLLRLRVLWLQKVRKEFKKVRV